MVSMVELEDGGGRGMIKQAPGAEVTRKTIIPSSPPSNLGHEKSRHLSPLLDLSPPVETETHGAVVHLGSLDLQKTVTIGPAQLGLTVDGEDVHLVLPVNIHQRNIEL